MLWQPSTLAKQIPSSWLPWQPSMAGRWAPCWPPPAAAAPAALAHGRQAAATPAVRWRRSAAGAWSTAEPSASQVSDQFHSGSLLPALPALLALLPSHMRHLISSAEPAYPPMNLPSPPPVHSCLQTPPGPPSGPTPACACRISATRRATAAPCLALPPAPPAPPATPPPAARRCAGASTPPSSWTAQRAAPTAASAAARLLLPRQTAPP